VKATGRGVYFIGREVARRLSLDITGARVAIQGFGNVGSVAAELFVQHGARIVAVQDHTATLYNPAGLDVARLQTEVKSNGGIAGYTGAEQLQSELFWDVESDFLIPAALEGQLNLARAERVKTRVVLEGANGPTTPDADLVLADRGIVVVPDVIANAGGVTVSYFEWVQDFNSYFWNEHEINQRLDQILTGAFTHIWETHELHKVSLRTAAFIVACTRVLQARAERGLYP
jgi:glutamate dehydrogenase (NAD(P)+)